MKILCVDKPHKMCRTSIYGVWCDMKRRCYNPKRNNYHSYGGRGITVCPTWKDSFVTFFNDMGERPDKNYSLDRIDNNKQYSKENCKWSTRSEQNNNTQRSIKYKGETASQASLRLGGDYNLVAYRIRVGGWSLEKAFTTRSRLNK